MSIKYHLEEINKLLTFDTNTLANLKANIQSLDNTINTLKMEISTMEQKKIKILALLENKITSVKPILEKLESQFLIKWLPKDKPSKVRVMVGDIAVESILYEKIDNVPILQYGAILQNHKVFLVFKFSKKDFVSISECKIVDYNDYYDNQKTICCNNYQCEFGNNCKYFHDPFVWKDSDHIQNFIKTYMVKKCPYFGDSTLIKEQIKTMEFSQLKTLARYCAIMIIYIHLCC